MSQLKSALTCATLESEIIQSKIQYLVAEKHLRTERQARGRASETAIRQVRELGKALAILYEKRDAAQENKVEVDAEGKASEDFGSLSSLGIPLAPTSKIDTTSVWTANDAQSAPSSRAGEENGKNSTSN